VPTAFFSLFIVFFVILGASLSVFGVIVERGLLSDFLTLIFSTKTGKQVKIQCFQNQHFKEHVEQPVESGEVGVA
jgi:hypothetical protein